MYRVHMELSSNSTHTTHYVEYYSTFELTSCIMNIYTKTNCFLQLSCLEVVCVNNINIKIVYSQKYIRVNVRWGKLY